MRRRDLREGGGLKGPPPLRPTGLLLRRDGTFIHEGGVVSHRKLHRAFLRGVRFLEDEGVWVVQLGQFRGQIDVEDTPFWITGFDPTTGGLMLTDATEEPLDPETLSLDPDGVLRCRVKRRFPARFWTQPQSLLFQHLEPGEAGWTLCLGPRRILLPGLPREE